LLSTASEEKTAEAPDVEQAMAATAKVGGKNLRIKDNKLSYRRGTARYVVSVEILPVVTQQCSNYMYLYDKY